MLFPGVLFFIFLIIIRPQDFVQGLVGTRIVFYVMGFMTIAWLLSDIKKELFRTQLDKFVVFFLIWCSVSAINTHWMSYVFETSIEQFKLLLVYFFVTTVINTKVRFNIALWCIIGFMFLVAAMGILQAHGIDLTGAGRLWAADKGVWQIRGAGNFDNPNDLAYSVVLIVPFALGRLLEGPGLAARFLCSGALATALYCIYLTQSRGGLLATTACFAFWFLSWVKSPTWKRIASVVSLAGVIAAFSLQTASYRDDESSMGRVEAWVAGMEMIQSHPLLGVGKDQFSEFHKRDAHNSYVRVGAENGFIGLYLFVGILTSLIHFLGRLEHSSLSEETRVFRAGFTGYFGSYVVASIFSSRAYDIVFLIMTAIFGALLRLQLPESKLISGNFLNRNVAISTIAVLIIWKFFLMQTW